MGRRKSKRKPPPKKKVTGTLETQFTCPFCNHEKSCDVKIPVGAGGRLQRLDRRLRSCQPVAAGSAPARSTTPDPLGVLTPPPPDPRGEVPSLLPLWGVSFTFSTFLSPGTGAPAHTGTQDLSPPPGTGPLLVGQVWGRGLTQPCWDLSPSQALSCRSPASCRDCAGAGPQGHGDRDLVCGQCVAAELPLNKRPCGAGPGLRVLVTAGATAGGAGTHGDGAVGSAGTVGPMGTRRCQSPDEAQWH
uniref:Transcription elongation factor 1 homolog n=1 Tax=Strix occidentalis caurina TaxID=311401 RepID=A0A8D0F9R5_STROC